MTPQWKINILESIEQNASRHDANYIQLASVDADNLPQVRSLVFRAFEDTNMVVHSDCRSNKMAQLAAQPRCQICWYFPITREQFRITGDAQIIKEGHAKFSDYRQAQWQTLSSTAKQSYDWPAPGVQVAIGALPMEEQPHASDTITPSNTQQGPDNTHLDAHEHFSLLIISPVAVDHLRLTRSPHSRVQYQKHNTDWIALPINP